MTPIEVAWFLVGVLFGAGVLTWFAARPMARLSVWWQSLWTRLPGLQWLSKFMYDERTAVVMMRVGGVSFIVFAILGAILAIVLPYTQLAVR